MHFDTFQLKKKWGNIEGNKSENDDYNFFFEEIIDENDKVSLNAGVFHLIFGNDFSQETILYNIFTINYIRNLYNNIPNIQPFDVIENVKKRIISSFRIFFDNIEIEENNLKIFTEENNLNLKLKIDENLELKKCLVDELGISNFTGNIYRYYITNNDLYIEM